MEESSRPNHPPTYPQPNQVTYPLHIILRFELEKALFDGSVEVADLPAEWNRRMKEGLNVDVPDNARGILQDVHWPVGALGRCRWVGR